MARVRTQTRAPRVGDTVSFPFGTTTLVALVVEDRGNLGRGGEQIVRVRVDLSDGTDPLFTEIPARVVTVVPAR